jgi:transposase
MKKSINRNEISGLGSADKTILIDILQEQIHLLKEKNQRLEERLKNVEGTLKKNSKNSSKPPSSDMNKPKKTKSMKKRTGKKPGGQKGHKGSTLEMHPKPDDVIRYVVQECEQCGNDLSQVQSELESRQEFEIPAPKMYVTEYQVESKDCKCCGYITTACFPEGISHKTQYGKTAKSLMVYMNQHQFLPYDRASQFFKAVYNHKVSPATIVNAVNFLAERLDTLDSEIKDFLSKAKIAHCDETSMSVSGDKHWLHTVGNKQVAHFELHKNRGMKATLDIGILPKFKGVLVHDHWKSYFRYIEPSHSLCNAHHLRELEFIHEHHRMKWAKKMSSLLVNIKEHKDKYAQRGKDEFSQRTIDRFTDEYEKILCSARREQARHGTLDSRNLIKRLANYRESVLMFMNDFDVPFTNNLSEQDLRMSKVKQKISGCFRSLANGNQFCRIRSLLISARKNRKNPFDIIQKSFQKVISLEEVMAT